MDSVKSTYHARVNGDILRADNLLELRQKVKSFIEVNNLTWSTVEGLYREKNGKIEKKYDR